MATLEVNVTLPPAQNVVAPPAVIVGVAGKGFTVTLVANDVADVQPFALVFTTVKLPLAVTFILAVVAPLLHTLPVAALEVNVTLPPAQNVVAPLADIVGVDGKGFTVTLVANDVADVHPFALVFTTVKLQIGRAHV